MKVYHGRRTEGGPRIVWVTDDGRLRWLEPRRDVFDHGGVLDWGPWSELAAAAQLALSILADCLGPPAAVRAYHDFRRMEVDGWGDEWDISEREVLEWAVRHTGP